MQVAHLLELTTRVCIILDLGGQSEAMRRAIE